MINVFEMTEASAQAVNILRTNQGKECVKK